jgi:glycosyltransferase involved in cell wall biosynthesis
MKVAIVDPYLFSLPYDVHLVEGLQQAGAEARVFGRAVGTAERATIGSTALLDVPYRETRRVFGSTFGPLVKAAKALGHGAGSLRLLRQLRAWRPDVIHFQWLPLPLVDGMVLRAVRSIATPVLTVHNARPYHGTPSSAFQLIGNEWAYRQAAGVVTLTERAENAVRAVVDVDEPVVRIPHGLMRLPRSVAPEVPQELRDATRATGQKAMILIFGEMKPYKGIDVLIEAFARLPGCVRARSHLVIAGRPQMDLAPLHQLIDERGVGEDVTMIPRFLAESEVAHLLEQATAVVFPYRDIDASGALMLALGSGRPVILSRIEGFAEFSDALGDDSYFEAGDAAELAARLSDVLARANDGTPGGGPIHRIDHPSLEWGEIGRRHLEFYARSGAGTTHAAGT